MDQLVQRANRHNADRVIVGEVLGDEIVPMLNAMTAGKAGSMCTIHADSTEGTFGRIQSYASQSPKHLSDAATAKLTAQALDLVVFVRQQPVANGFARRFVSSIRVVEDSDGPHVISTEIFAEPRGRRPGDPPLRRATWPPGPPGRLRLRSADCDLRPMTVLIVLCLHRRRCGHRPRRGRSVRHHPGGKEDVVRQGDRHGDPPISSRCTRLAPRWSGSSPAGRSELSSERRLDGRCGLRCLLPPPIE